jgi:hypothetical protein
MTSNHSIEFRSDIQGIYTPPCPLIFLPLHLARPAKALHHHIHRKLLVARPAFILFPLNPIMYNMPRLVGHVVTKKKGMMTIRKSVISSAALEEAFSKNCHAPCKRRDEKLRGVEKERST